MLVTMRLTVTTYDVDESIDQTVAAFGLSLAQACRREVPFEKITELAFCFGVAHPLRPPPGKGSASYSRDSGVFFVEGRLDYEAWLGDRWSARVQAVARAAENALSRVHKTRLTAEERMTLSRLIKAEAARVEASPPDRRLPLKPIYVVEDRSGRRLSVGFRSPDVSLASGDQIVREIPPSDAAAYHVEHIAATQVAQMVKLYKRHGDRLLYREAWAEGAKVVEHVGLCGDRGSISEHPAEGVVQQQDVIAAIAADARADGFESVSDSSLIGLVVSTEISGAGSPDDLMQRHALEDFLNEVTGWLGLGHCDGGSTGSGSMEVLCLVVDYAIASEAIIRELSNSRFRDFAVNRAVF